MNIKYDSWNLKYKKPFGAIKTNTEVTWKIEIDTPVNQVILWLTKAGEQPVAYPMNNDAKTNYYQTSVVITTSGLYHYYFEIKKGDQTLYYVQDEVEMGKLVTDFNQIVQFQQTCYDQEVPTVDWYRRGIVYQIFPDRFANGNEHGEVIGRKKNSFIYATKEDTPYYITDKNGVISRWDFFGGNLAGIRKKIPYLKELGVTAIYLNPIFLATSNHRYDTSDFMQIDPMLGDEEEFKRLLDSLHQNKMHLILDGVFNHVGYDSKYFQGALTSVDNQYYPWFMFTNYPTAYQSWWGVSTLPEVDKNNLAYQDLIYGKDGVLDKWTKMGVDGWRLDVADELPMDFLKKIRQRLADNNCQVEIGEVWEDASCKYVNDELRTYTAGDNLTGVMNYPVRSFILQLLQAGSHAQLKRAIVDFLRLVENYPFDFLLNCLNNIGTHDTVRIKTTLNKDEKLVALAFALLFMLPGVPCIYYGDEAGLEGKTDPDNRRYFPWGRESKFLAQKVNWWCKFRKETSALLDGKVGMLMDNQGLIGVVRYNTDKIIICLCNKTDQELQVDANLLEFYALPDLVKSQLLKHAKKRTLAPKTSTVIIDELEN